jgi:sec-independent protein translocase protein TatA
MTQFYVLAGAIGPTEVILIVVVIVLLFGGRKIPELMKGIGQGMKEFKKASQLDSEDKSADLKEDKKETIK